MATEFKLPELGENIETAEIVRVAVSEGDTIQKDDIVLEIETDKATVEVPSEVSGKIKKVHVKDGDTAKVGDTILTLEDDGSSEEEDKDEKKEEKKEDQKEKEAEKKEQQKKEKESKEEKTEKKEEAKKEKKKTESGTYEFKLPELGENIESADVTSVLVKEGDQVKEDDPVLEIETDKATVEVPIDKTGKVKEVKIKEGEQAKVGETVLVIETGGEDVEEKPEEDKKEPKKEDSKEKEEAEEKEEKKELEVPTEKDEEGTKTVKTPTDATHSARQFKKDLPDKIAPASPSVRRFAREIGVDVHQVKGSGPGGRISVDDVKAFAKNINEKISKSGGRAVGVAQEPLPDFSKWGDIERESMSNIRKKTAEHLSYAWSTIPHVTQFDKADITELEKLRKNFSKQVESAGGKLTVTSILVKIIAAALKKFPQFNSSIDMDKKEVIYKKYYSVGIAVDTERGLLVPVVRDVDKKSITQISIEVGELAEKARDKKLSLEEMQGGNFSISNLGGIGGTYFTPIVNSPEVAILGVSRGNYEQVYNKEKGEFETKMMLPLSLSYDHRIIDGADAIRFLRWVVEALENPFKLLLEG